MSATLDTLNKERVRFMIVETCHLPVLKGTLLLEVCKLDEGEELGVGVIGWDG